MPPDQNKGAGKTTFGSSIFDGISGVLGTVNPVLAGLSQGAGLIGGIAGLFSPNLDKTTAAALQQSIEKFAMDLEQQVNAGTMDPAAAIQQLKVMQSQMQGGGATTPEMANGKLMANIILNQVIANLQTRQTTKLNDPFGAGPWNGGSAPQDLGGNPEQQKERLKTGIRNAIAGTDLGKTFAESSPVYQTATSKAQSPFDRLPTANKSIQDQFPVDLPDLRRPLKEARF